MRCFVVAAAICGVFAGSPEWTWAADVAGLLGCSSFPEEADQAAEEQPENAVVPLPRWPVPSNNPPRVIFPHTSRTAKKPRPVIAENSPQTTMRVVTGVRVD